MKALTRLLFLTAFLAGAGACNDTDRPAAVTVPTGSADPYRLASTVRPLSQALELRLDPAAEQYSGATTILIEVQETAGAIRLHAEDLEIRALRLSAAGVELPVSYEIGEHALLRVTGDEAFDPGTYELTIEFANDFNTDGAGINRLEQAGDYYIFSQFQPDDAREAFPCFDEPGFKYPWQLTIATPEGLLAVTNEPEESSASADGWNTTVFARTPPLPSYLVAVAVGPFDTVPIEGMSAPGRVVVPRGQVELAGMAAEMAPPIMEYLENYFGEPYPYRKLDLIGMFGMFSGAMEHPGAITYSDSLLLLDENASSQQKQYLARVHAHEFAHQWFGDLVTMKWWDDFWLNESFADWMADKTSAAVFPEFGGAANELGETLRVMDSDASPAADPIRRQVSATDNFFDGVWLAYYKGKAVLRMFEQAVGADVFRDGVVRYIRKHRNANAGADDLWTELGEGADFDLAAGLASFVNQPGIPVVTVRPAAEGRLTFTQSRFVTGEGKVEPAQWIIPVRYRLRTPEGMRTATLVLDETSETVDAGADLLWVFPNADQLGYYRWDVPADMLARIGADAATDLNVPERMGMLSNMWALVAADTLDADAFLEALAGMSGETDPEVFTALLDQLSKVGSNFITPDLRDEFAAYLRRLLNPALARIGTEPLADDDPGTEALRPQLLLWLADYGRDEGARAATAELVERHLDGELPLGNAVRVALRTQARIGNAALFDELVALLDAAETPTARDAYLSAIGSFRDPELVERALDFAMRDSLRPDELSGVLLRLAGWADNLGMLFDWMVENDAALRERLTPETMSYVPLVVVECDPEVMPAVREFYGAPEREVPGIEERLRDAEVAVNQCSDLRQRELPSVSRYLEGAAP